MVCLLQSEYTQCYHYSGAKGKGGGGEISLQNALLWSSEAACTVSHKLLIICQGAQLMPMVAKTYSDSTFPKYFEDDFLKSW